MTFNIDGHKLTLSLAEIEVIDSAIFSYLLKHPDLPIEEKEALNQIMGQISSIVNKAREQH